MPGGFAGKESVRARLEEKAFTALGLDLAAQSPFLLDHGDLDVGGQGPGAPGGAEAGHAASQDDETLHSAAFTAAASASMNKGSSFRAGGRSSRTPAF